MPKSPQKVSQSRYLPVVIACCLLIGGAMWASALLPESAPTADLPREGTAPATFSCTLKAWEGNLARFDGDAAAPAQVYDVAVATLPEEVQQALAAGVTLSSEEELAAWLENVTS